MRVALEVGSSSSSSSTQLVGANIPSQRDEVDLFKLGVALQSAGSKGISRIALFQQQQDGAPAVLDVSAHTSAADR